MGKGLLYCADRGTDCMEIYMGNGTCRLKSCALDDPEYIKKEKEKELRRNELLQKELKRRREETAAATKIRKQNKTADSMLLEQIENIRTKMERYYTRGWTKAADKLSRELSILEKRLEELS